MELESYAPDDVHLRKNKDLRVVGPVAPGAFVVHFTRDDVGNVGQSRLGLIVGVDPGAASDPKPVYRAVWLDPGPRRYSVRYDGPWVHVLWSPWFDHMRAGDSATAGASAEALLGRRR